MPWVAGLALLVIGGIRLTVLLEPVAGFLPGCAFKRLTGLACLTCGLTRCVLALGRWDWPAAFHWHPAATVAVALLPVAAMWDARRAWRGEPYPALPDSRSSRLSAWIILLSAWALQVVRGI
jgi:uncharacterized membrane protein YoaK (UPF0700 family)